MIRKLVLVLGVVFLAGPAEAQSPRVDVGLQLGLRRLSEFDQTELGLGAHVSYRVHRAVAVLGEVSLFPADLGSPAFTGSRREGLVGLRLGPRLGRRGGYL